MEIKQDFIPIGDSNRPQRPLSPTFITIHETANTSRGANAEMHARYVKGPDARARQVSWHYTVDDSVIIQHLPVNEVAWHAGSNGNAQSIGIEICVNQDGDFNQAKARAAGLVRLLMVELSVSLANVVTHKHWTGKDCPARLLNEWAAFKDLIQSPGNNDPVPVPPGGRIGTVRVLAESLWVYDRPDWNARYQTVSKGEVFTVVEELIVSGSKMYKLLSGLYITANTLYVAFTRAEGSSSGEEQYTGKWLRSKVNGLHFYDKPRWTSPSGTVNKGEGFPTVVRKLTVESGEQYEVKNSRGHSYYVTANSEYVYLD